MSKSPLYRMLLVNGSALGLQGVADLALRPWLHLGETLIAAAESNARFLGGLLLGVGIFWIALSRRSVLPLPAVQVLAGGMLLGVAGRLLSLIVTGSAAPLMLVVIEAVTTALVLLFSLRARSIEMRLPAAV